MNSIRMGVVGMRNLGRNHARKILDATGCELTAIAETDADRLAEAKAEFGDVEAMSDAQAMFDREDLDAVVLGVPNPVHASLTIAALEAGKHVLVEKPLARTMEEAERMIAARDRSGRALMVGMNQRFHPEVAGLRRAIADGALGRYQFGRTWWTQRRPNPGLWERGDWFLSPETAGGGPMLDLGIHRLDLAMHLLGFPEVASVSGVTCSGIGEREAEQRGKRYDIEDGATGWVRFTDGTALEVEASYFRNIPESSQRTMLLGDRAGLFTGEPSPLMSYETGEPEPLAFTPDESVARSPAEHFVRVLRGEEPLSPTAEQGRVGLWIVRAIYQSAATGEPVTPPAGLQAAPHDNPAASS